MEQIIYVVSVILLFLAATLIKIKDEKINFISHLGISIVVFLCYNSFVCLILTIICIPTNLIALSIINFIISLILFVIIKKQNCIQKYTINYKDVIATILILMIAITTSVLNFGKDLNIKYLATDASMHYKAAKEFSENDKLLYKVNEDIGISKEFMTGAYTNTGILFKIFNPIVGEMNLYKVFICFDILLYFLTGLMLYIAISKLIKTKFTYILSLLFIILYLIGYPLNSLIFGFTYFQLGILIVETIVVFFQEEKNEKISKNKKILGAIILFLLNFGVFFSYLLLVPIIYATEGIYFLIKEYKNNKKYFTKKSILTILFTLVIPFIIGIFYFALPHLFARQSEFFLQIEGYIYRNYWSNFILLLPIAVLCFKKKNNEIQFLEILFITLFLFMIAMFIGIWKFQLSSYYYCKNNFLLWFILWYGMLYSFNIYADKKIFKTFIIIYSILYMFFTGLLIYIGTPISKKVWDKETILNSFDIYGINKTIIKTVDVDYTYDELELVKYVYNDIDLKENKILILANARQECWFDGFFTYKNREDLQKLVSKEEIQNWNDNEKYKYAIIFKRSYIYDHYKDLFEEKNVLFQNESGIVFENNV